MVFLSHTLAVLLQDHEILAVLLFTMQSCSVNQFGSPLFCHFVLAVISSLSHSMQGFFTALFWFQSQPHVTNMSMKTLPGQLWKNMHSKFYISLQIQILSWASDTNVTVPKKHHLCLIEELVTWFLKMQYYFSMMHYPCVSLLML